jgi:hypothetical protein
MVLVRANEVEVVESDFIMSKNCFVILSHQKITNGRELFDLGQIG